MKKFYALLTTVLLFSCSTEPIPNTIDESQIPLVHKDKSDGKTTSIPDPNFEQFLIDLGYDDILDGQVLTKTIESIEALGIASNQPISDLTGIEDFKSLQTLSLQYLDISSLDFSKQKQLKILQLYNLGNITSLDISELKNLEILSINETEIDVLDLSKNKKLKSLLLFRCGISDLNISKSKKLDALYYYDSPGLPLDLSKNSKLTLVSTTTSNFNAMELSDNKDIHTVQINDILVGNEYLDLSKVPDISNLFIRSEQLSFLDVSQNDHLVVMDVMNNPFTCIQVNENQLANIPSGWSKDVEDVYALNCE